MDAWKKLNYQKLVKDASNLASFYGSHIDGMVCVKQIDLRSARTSKFYKNELTLISLLPVTS